MNNIEELKKENERLREEIEKLKKENKELKDFQERTRESGRDLSELGANLTIIGQGIKDVGSSMQDAGKKVVGTLGNMVEAGAEYQVEQAAITTMLGDQEEAVRSWAKTQASALGLTEQQLTLVTAKNIMLAEKMGLSGDEAREMAQQISIATQDLATFYDIPVEEMQSKFNSALNGSRVCASCL